MMDNFKNLFKEETEYFEDDELEKEIVEETDETFDVHLDKTNSTVSGSKAIVKIYEPITKNASKQIIDSIRRGELCIINFAKLSDDEQQLIFATLSGSVYSLDAVLKRVDDNILICAPKNFLVDGDVA